MYEAFSLLISIPGAIDSVLNIIDCLKKNESLSASSQQELNQIRKGICEVYNTLSEFTISFNEIAAWKSVHEITNRILTDLSEVFILINGSKDSYDFVNNIFPTKRENIIRGIKTMFLNESSMPKICFYETKSEFMSILICLKDTNDDKIHWHEWIRKNVNLALKEAEDYSHGKEVYGLLGSLYRYCMVLNHLADKTIIDCITKYHNDTEILRRQLEANSNLV